MIDYVNRFWTQDVDARMQLFDLKTKYTFETIPQICNYNMPLYSIQTEPGDQNISYYPVYQGFTGTSYVNGIQIPMSTQRDSFYKIWPNYIQPLTQVALGDGSTTIFTFDLPFFPAIPGHVDMTGVIAAANGGSLNDPIFATQIPNDAGTPRIPYSSINPGVFITYQNDNGGVTTIADSGVFLSTATDTELTGILVQYSNPGSFNPNPFGYSLLGTTTTANSTVNYITGEINVTFPTPPAADTPIQVQCYFIQQGLPRAFLFYNNVITLQPPSNIPYLIELDAYLTPAAFLSTSQAVQFGYMSEYIARGAARKILSDTGDWEQFQAYEPLFIEQERLVWKRSQRIFTANRTGTIYSELQGPQAGAFGIGQGGL